METKPRILYLLKVLQERTDEEHPLTTSQLIEILNTEFGMPIDFFIKICYNDCSCNMYTP